MNGPIEGFMFALSFGDACRVYMYILTVCRLIHVTAPVVQHFHCHDPPTKVREDMTVYFLAELGSRCVEWRTTC